MNTATATIKERIMATATDHVDVRRVERIAASIRRLSNRDLALLVLTLDPADREGIFEEIVQLHIAKKQ